MRIMPRAHDADNEGPSSCNEVNYIYAGDPERVKLERLHRTACKQVQTKYIVCISL